MDDSKIFIVGANGQLGKALGIKYPNAKLLSSADLDITDKKSFQKFNWQNANVIINAAAYTDVDGAETAAGRINAWAVNAYAVANLVAVSTRYNATLVHISTDYVFDGTKKIHNEDETLSPLSVYGASKAAGDVAVSLAPKFYIIRTSWVIGEGKNFVRTMLELGNKGINPKVVSDQVGRPTFTNEIVRAIDHLLTTKASYGIYNVSNDGQSVSWAEITRKIFSLAKFNNSVTDILTKDYYAGKNNTAMRPLNSTLNLGKIQNSGFKSLDWQTELKAYVEKEIKN